MQAIEKNVQRFRVKIDYVPLFVVFTKTIIGTNSKKKTDCIWAHQNDIVLLVHYALNADGIFFI